MGKELISEKYRAEQVYLHTAHKKHFKYGTGGPQWALAIDQIAASNDCHTILDYGCGKGLLAKALTHRAIRNYDPAVPWFADAPASADLVVCLDVLEHIEPECLDAVLEHLLTLARKLLFVVVSTKSTARVLRDGRNAHLIIKNDAWWADKFRQRGCHVTAVKPIRQMEWAALINR